MYGTRYIIRPAGGRVARACAPAASRGMSCVPGPFFARQSYPQSDFNQLFRLFDEQTKAFDNFWPLANTQSGEASRRSFAPRFDVQEVEGGYELRGELPGVEAQDLQVEFTDPKTLVISGRTEREATSGTPPQAVQAAPEQQQQVEAQAADTSDTASVHSEGSGSSYQRPTVEDDYVDAGEEASSAPAQRTDTTATAVEQPVAAPEQTQQPQQPQNHYWVSERSVGQFSRTFTFPVNVDQDAVTASLKNGLLNITVPKAKAPEVRKIQVE